MVQANATNRIWRRWRRQIEEYERIIQTRKRYIYLCVCIYGKDNKRAIRANIQNKDTHTHTLLGEPNIAYSAHTHTYIYLRTHI